MLTAWVDKESVSALEHAYSTLRRLILQGQLGPGEPLTGARLSDILAVSRTPVRAALVRLEAEGLVESAQGRSARVRPITVAEVEQGYDVASGLEGVLVYRLAQIGTEEQFRAIAEAVGQMEEAALAQRKQAWAEADERFHSLLSQFGGNPLLSLMMERVETVIGRLRFLALHLDPLNGRGSADEHRAVSEALSDRQGKLARDLHQAHWDRVREVNTSLLRNGLPGTSAYLFEGSLTRTAEGRAKQNTRPVA